MPTIRLLALCGSLRAASLNRMALQAAQRLAPPGMDIQISPWPAVLPLFNFDLDQAGLPPVEALRAEVDAADAILIASPEYAHGIAGPMKNALDWLVSMPDFPGKPVALVNTSPRAAIALDALREVLRTMSARLLPAADIVLPLQGARLDLDGILARPDLCAEISRGLARLAVECRFDPQ